MLAQMHTPEPLGRLSQCDICGPQALYLCVVLSERAGQILSA